ncbi:hypothetical protein [Burkholderia oklahomensis]|uniref:Uncharacterized protein n=1 Tax=Burkholderia oklahomensis TaxID=342113 RepID=A0AAI8B3F7_9BURK|nr:hypothetical protein [Burkholderia oklahomensis]AIO65358.1 hypothetical protein DM82_731 [Burkholderia oklahomensis]AJX31317.1 hypothetical protein BG90_286 [Burkholderia oklahomensis C6786]MBI0360904.1 hypothetical protein [Burkholderia oklahomensis]MDN7675042.1 hypothetical protein [Burkholderia oklahomensis]QPS37665.1 hypothetical protein I6G57_02005 [Burkholderia oklahomensis]
MADSRIIWGSVNADGTIKSGSGNFAVERIDTGKYTVSFNAGFSTVPAVVATQNNYGGTNESNLDGVAVPFVNQNSFQANTGDGGGKPQNRSFGFIAIGF